MTSFTRKLHKTNPSAAVQIHRMRYGKNTTLATFTMGDRQDEEIAAEFRAANPRKTAHIEPEFEVANQLNRWSDRGWK